MKKLQIDQAEKIVSPLEGEIVGINITRGASVIVGKDLFILSHASASKSLEAVIFVNHKDGKKLAIGMQAFVLPTMLTQYDYGYIKGTLISVSPYPITKESALVYLGNATLVDEYFIDGAPFMAKIQLNSNDKNPEYLEWTAKRKANIKIHAGASINANIVIKTCPPWRLLINCK